MPGLPPAGPPRLDLPASLGGNLPPPRGSDPLMSLGPSAPPSAGHNSAPGLRAPSSNEKVIGLLIKGSDILLHSNVITPQVFLLGWNLHFMLIFLGRVWRPHEIRLRH